MRIVTLHAYPLGLCYCSVRMVTIYEVSHYTYISYDLGILLYPDRHFTIYPIGLGYSVYSFIRTSLLIKHF